jgi:HEPN domain-containing protein
MNDQDKRPVETPRSWIQYALGDLGVAEREIKHKKPAYHTICFLCQSAAEKFLKGFLIAQGWRLEKTHDMVALIAYCADHDSELGNMTAEGIVLNEYVIAGRYPDDLSFDEIGRAQAEEALVAAQNIAQRVMTLMAKPASDNELPA